jgi:hypothetical protein
MAVITKRNLRGFPNLRIRCFPNLRIRVFAPGNKESKRYKLIPGPGQFFSPQGIEAQLDHFASELEKHWPQEVYKLVPLGPNAFNFVWQGTETPEPQEASI